MKKYEFSNDELIFMHNLYEAGYNLSFIQNVFNVSKTVLQRVFKENNWKLRTSFEHFIKYSVDDYYFDTIDTPNKAYCMGLFYADGYNFIPRGTIRIELQARDVNVLHEINKLVKNTRPLMFLSAENKKNRVQDSYVLYIQSEHMSKRLNDLGFIQNKSLDLEFPTWITEDLFPFFLKGYIDGDGWIQKYRIGLMSSDKFCYGTKDFLFNHYGITCTVMDMKRHYKSQTKTLYIYNRKNIYPLCEMMFSKETICIERKCQKYLEFGFIQQYKQLSMF